MSATSLSYGPCRAKDGVKAVNTINSKIDSETKRIRRLIRMRLVRMRLRLSGAIYIWLKTQYGAGVRRGMPGGGAKL